MMTVPVSSARPASLSSSRTVLRDSGTSGIAGETSCRPVWRRQPAKRASNSSPRGFGLRIFLAVSGAGSAFGMWIFMAFQLHYKLFFRIFSCTTQISSGFQLHQTNFFRILVEPYKFLQGFSSHKFHQISSEFQLNHTIFKGFKLIHKMFFRISVAPQIFSQDFILAVVALKPG
jgi:hypothetical protein